MGLFPDEASAARAWLRNEAAVQAALPALSAALGLAPLARFARGSCLVAGTKNEVLKVFLPEDHAHARAEAAALRALQDQLSVPTPRFLAEGRVEAWPYVLMSRLDGLEATEVWERLTHETRQALCEQLGGALAELHRQPPPRGVELVDWPSYARRRMASAHEDQSRQGCPAALARALPPFLAALELDRAPDRAWLHTEIMLEHLLVAPDGSRWAGLFDFEPSWVAPPEYELASVGLFVARGNAELLTAVRRGLGWPADEARAGRLFGYTCLHRYSRLAWYLERLGTAPPHTPERLAEAWFKEM